MGVRQPNVTVRNQTALARGILITGGGCLVPARPTGQKRKRAGGAHAKKGPVLYEVGSSGGGIRKAEMKYLET